MKARISLGSRLAVALTASALVLTGCASSSDSGGDNKDKSAGGLSKAEIYKDGLVNVKEAEGDPVKGGTLTVADFGEPRSLNPTQTYANGATGGSAMAAIYDTLTRYDVAKKEFVPQLAESLDSEDNKTWTLKLREGVKFSDGTDLDADAVLASMKYYLANYGYQSQLLLTSLAESKKVDDMTVEFSLRTPWATFPNMMAQGPGMVLAPAAYKDEKNFKPVGAGPFTLDHYSPGEELVLKANKDYWDKAPYLENLRFIWLGAADDGPKYDALKSGDADTAFLRDPAVIEKARDAGTIGMMYATGLGDNFWMNTRQGRPGADPLVRKAINLSFDPVSYLKRIQNGAGQPTKSLFAPASPWATDVKPAPADPAEAKKVFKEATDKGFNGKISYTHNADPSSQTAAVTVKAMLEATGFKVTLVPLRSVADQVQKLYIDHDFDMAVAATSVLEQDPYAGLANVLNSKSGANLSGYTSKEMDGLLAQLQAADSPESGKGVMTKIEELWNKDQPGIGIAAQGSYLPWGKDVYGIKPTAETMMLYDKAWKKK